MTISVMAIGFKENYESPKLREILVKDVIKVSGEAGDEGALVSPIQNGGDVKFQ